MHVATGGNSLDDYTTISNAVVDNDPNAVVMVTPVWNPGGASDGVYNDHPVGVFYTDGHWAIFNQDLAAIPAGAAFAVHAWSAPTSTAMRSTGTPGGDAMTVDSPVTTGKSGALVWATANWEPNQVYDNHPIGVFYNTRTWAVFNEDQQGMPASVTFNVVVGGKGARASFTHTATAANSSANYTDIDNPATNGRPNALVFITQSWGRGVYNNHNVGVWYHDGKWAIFNQDNNSAVPANATFTVVVY